MSILSSLATQLPTSVLDTLGEIINSEHVDLSVKQDSSSLDFLDTHTEYEGKKTVDFRVNHNFVKLHSLCNSTAFMNAKSEVGIKSQINTLYRLRDLCKDISFRTIKHSEVTKQYGLAISARREENKFSTTSIVLSGLITGI